MKNFRNLLLALATFLFISCGSIEFTGHRDYDLSYDYYNYSQINRIYIQNPRWFYDNYYLDDYGRQRYYHMHPYYIRYVKQKAKHTKRNSHSVHTRKTKRMAPTYSNPRSASAPTRTDSPGSRTYNLRNTTRSDSGINTTKRTIKRRTTNPTIRKSTTVRRSSPVRNKIVKRNNLTQRKSINRIRRN